MGEEFVRFSLAPLLIGVLAAMACALPGNFLLLRRQAMIGDAISHVVLPGIVVAFLLTGSVTTWPMMLGALGAAALSAVLIELVRRFGRVEPGAAMGVVFTTLFALGVLMLERANLGRAHLDVQHALYGNLESLMWLRSSGWSSLLDPQALARLPEELPRMAGVAGLMGLLTLVFWRPLKIASFDEGFARSLGIPVRGVSFGIVLAAAAACVAAFDAVGSIIVIAMLVCPPATARLMTDRLSTQVWLSLGFAAFAATAGYVLAGYGPIWLGGEHAVSAAGMIATVAGLTLGIAALCGPHRRRDEAGESQPL
ncbi:metal ABC transporter permease [Neomegalonema sp.]|uniref:metal ABC transporter permease n=1 Tax=Neomegalonema sp. TaxID=2039713 RepID=UPI002608098F|nr:metal ABC transporter permease [Neomegalonema sp.]MDD2870040.1 metal ABC transporter permease [Neomegalonema sp.]